jgi:hypothetical protein
MPMASKQTTRQKARDMRQAPKEKAQTCKQEKGCHPLQTNPIVMTMVSSLSNRT